MSGNCFRLLPAAWCLGLLLLPPGAQALDLSQAWSLALAHDPELSAARHTLAAREEKVPQSRSALLPEAILTAKTSDNRRSIQGRPIEHFNSHDWNASLTQPVLSMPDWYNLKAAKSETRQAQLEFTAQLQNLMIEVANAYFGVLRARDNRNSARAAEKAFESQLRLAEERFKVGLSAITDVHEARAAYDAARVERITLDGIADIAQEVLESRIGQPFEHVAMLNPEMPLALPEPFDVEHWEQAALQRNHALQAIRETIRQTDATIQSRKAEHLPSVEFYANYGRTVQGGANFLGNKIDNQSLGLRLTMPLFSGGATSSRVREAHLLHLTAEDEARAAERNIRENIRTLHTQVTSDLLLIQAQQQAALSARFALDATEAGFQVGTRNVVDVLDARRAMHEAERDYADARYNFVVNLLRLHEAAGTLDMASLDRINRWLR